jgi:hypothetical protein
MRAMCSYLALMGMECGIVGFYQSEYNGAAKNTYEPPCGLQCWLVCKIGYEITGTVKGVY